VLDARLNEEVPVADILSRLEDNLPPDIKVIEVKSVDERLPALQTQALSAAYDVHLTEPIDGSELKRRVESVMMAESIPRERRGKSYDLRPLIEMMSVITQADGRAWLKMTLAAREGATGRPEEVLAALGIEPETARVERARLIFKD
jgi:radical SAM-linked protein